MKDDQRTREQVIAFIKDNEPLLAKVCFDAHSLTELVILKTEIEVKIRKGTNKT